MPHLDTFEDGWVLVLAIWGEKFHSGHVNALVRNVREHSPDCNAAILITDRPRPDIDPWITQAPIPAEFDRPEFFRSGYIVKLSVFAAPELPPRTRCVFLDLDTLVLGDLGRLARMVRRHEDMLMLPPATVGFNRLSRLIYRLSSGRKFRTGNSSVIAYSSDGGRALAARYLELYADPETRNAPYLKVDDAFVSWFGQPVLRDVPRSLAVMLRREFLSRIPFWPTIKTRLPWTIRRRAELGAITLNGVDYKPEVMLQLADGAVIQDSKGRRGLWSERHFGSLLPRIKALCAASAAQGPAASDSGVR